MTMTSTTSASQVRTIAPVLTVNDLQASIAFFEGLGFGMGERWEHEGKLVGVMVKAGDLEIGLSQDDWAKGRDRQKGLGVRVFITTTQNIDELAARAKQAGVKFDKEPHDTPWGARAIDLTAPSGFKLTISSHQE